MSSTPTSRASRTGIWVILKPLPLAHDISQSAEQKDMRRVGHVDLQGRPAYQPNVIVYPNGRTIAFVGTHGGSKPNPLNGGAEG